MKDLAVRLAALDADAGAALRVIAYFDSLTESRAGVQAIVRGAAVLAGVPARLDDAKRRVHVRVTPEGRTVPLAEPVAAAWPRTEVGEQAELALERTGAPGPVDAMILERAAAAVRLVLDRTRGRVPAPDPALVELVVDAGASPDVRKSAAYSLGVPAAGPVRAVALPTGPALLVEGAPRPSGRAGIGPAGAPPDLPSSYRAALVALRFAADGTAEDPGERVVAYEQLGALVLLAAAPMPADLPDLRALDHAIAAAPWALATAHAVAVTGSLRSAAAALRLHHSTLQDRIGHLEHLLGWPVREPDGKLRLQLALAARRLQRHPAQPPG